MDEQKPGTDVAGHLADAIRDTFRIHNNGTLLSFGASECMAEAAIRALQERTAPQPAPDAGGLVERLSLHRSWRDSHGELNDAPLAAAAALTDLQAKLEQARAALTWYANNPCKIEIGGNCPYDDGKLAQAALTRLGARHG